MQSHNADNRKKAVREAQLVIIEVIHAEESKRSYRFGGLGRCEDIQELHELFESDEPGERLLRANLDQLMEFDDAGSLTNDSRQCIARKSRQEAKMILGRLQPRKGDGLRAVPLMEGYEEIIPSHGESYEDVHQKMLCELLHSVLVDELSLPDYKALIGMRALLDSASYDDIKLEVKERFGMDLTNENLRQIASRITKALRSLAPEQLSRYFEDACHTLER